MSAPENNGKPAGIKEIAAALGISIGTVDRALHGRPGVSAKTRAKVIKMAEKLNYRPNIAARNLKLNRRLRIGVYLPQEIASFFDPLRDGIRAAEAAAGSLTVDLEFHSFPRLGAGDAALLENSMHRDYDGILLTPGNPATIYPLIQRLSQRGTAVVCVASDAPRTERLACISVDATVSGGIAAELLARAIGEPSSVATITGDLSTLDHAEKLRGFAATLATLAPHLRLLPPVESHESAEEAYQATLVLLSQHPGLTGLYVSTANSLPVLRALRERRSLDSIRIITTDLFSDLVPFIQAGQVLATLYQRPVTQGKVAFETLTRYLVEGSRPEPSTRLAPHILLRSNLPLFTSRLVSSVAPDKRRVSAAQT